MQRKPAWLNKKISLSSCSQMKEFLRLADVKTVCEQALCPNMGECFSRRQATFLILGKHCTRLCSFCNIDKGVPEPLDGNEPQKVADAVKRLSLKHVVITSVTRDDLIDGGAGVFAQTVTCIKELLSDVCIEILIPDFRMSLDALFVVVSAHPDIIAHNVETVPSLYPFVRSDSEYSRSLQVLQSIKEMNPFMKTKSGIMLGLGETEIEVESVMSDLRKVQCDFLSIGQYLAPSKRHFPVKEYIPEGQFEQYKQRGLKHGFLHVESAPYVRSSYHADAYV